VEWRFSDLVNLWDWGLECYHNEDDAGWSDSDSRCVREEGVDENDDLYNHDTNDYYESENFRCPL
jgi:hypothetical protein